MVVEGDPAPGARVLIYDIKLDQLAWSRFVLAHATEAGTLASLSVRSRYAALGS